MKIKTLLVTPVSILALGWSSLAADEIRPKPIPFYPDYVQYNSITVNNLTKNGQVPLVLPKRRQIKINLQELPGTQVYSCFPIDFTNVCGDGSCTITLSVLRQDGTTGPNHDAAGSASKRFIVDSFNGFFQPSPSGLPLTRRLSGFTYIAANTPSSQISNVAANDGNNIIQSGMGESSQALLTAFLHETSNNNSLAKLGNWWDGSSYCNNANHSERILSGGLPNHVFIAYVTKALTTIFVED
jgi:hypothetical protein